MKGLSQGCIDLLAKLFFYALAFISGDNGYLILKPLIFSSQFYTPHFDVEHISAHTIFNM